MRKKARENWVPVVKKAETLCDCRIEESVRQTRGRKNMTMDSIQSQQRVLANKAIHQCVHKSMEFLPQQG